MPRLVLNDEFWSELNKFLFQEAIYYKKHNLRMTVESMMYRMQVGCPRRDLPKAMGWSLHKYPHLVECFSPAKAVSGTSDTIRQTEQKFCEYGSHGVGILWLSM